MAPEAFSPEGRAPTSTPTHVAYNPALDTPPPDTPAPSDAIDAAVAAGGGTTVSTAPPPSAPTPGVVSGDFHTRMAQIMSIINGTGAEQQAETWADQTAAPTAGVGQPGALAPAGHLGVSSAGGVDFQHAYQLALGAGATADEARTLAAIAGAESGYRPTAHNPNASTGDNSYGLWQINMLGKMGENRAKTWGLDSYDQLFDPETNARAAIAILRSQGLKAWTTYTSGAYRKFLQ